MVHRGPEATSSRSPQHDDKFSELVHLMHYLRLFWRDFLKQYKKLFLAVGALMALSIALQLPAPLLTMYLVDSAVEAADPDVITQIALVLVALVVARHIFWYLNDNITLHLRERIILDVGSHLIRHLQRLPLGFFSGRQSSYLQARLMNDSREIEGALVRTVITVLMDGLTFLVGSVIILWIRFELGLVLILSILPFAYIRYYANEKMRVLSGDMQERFAQASATLGESFAGIRTTKALGQEEMREAKVIEKLDGLRDIYVRTNWFGVLSGIGTSFITSLSTAFVLWFGLRSVLRNEMTLGQVVGVLTMFSFLYGPVNSFVAANLSIQRAGAAIRRIYEFLSETPEETEADERIEIGDAAGEIVFRDVTFGYDPEVPVLSRIDLEIPAGQVLALVGKSGAGKSTLINLLMRFYVPNEGEVRLDGLEVSTLSLRSLRNTVGLVDQQAFLFTGTILENIRLGAPDATMEEVEAAAKSSHAHDFIMQLPDGYDSQVGERGVRLSGGQCQRIALARIFLRNPAVVILDEAVSAVDSESEEAIQSALETLSRGRTTIIVAHRLSSLLLAERVVLIEDGRVVEDGSHASLLARKGAYDRLFKQQFKPQLGPEDADASPTAVAVPAAVASSVD